MRRPIPTAVVSFQHSQIRCRAAAHRARVAPRKISPFVCCLCCCPGQSSRGGAEPFLPKKGDRMCKNPRDDAVLANLFFYRAVDDQVGSANGVRLVVVTAGERSCEDANAKPRRSRTRRGTPASGGARGPLCRQQRTFECRCSDSWRFTSAMPPKADI